MKKNLLRLSVWAATLLMASTLTSCVTESDEAPETVQTGQSNLIINLSTDRYQTTRATTITSDPTSSVENTVNNIVIAIFDQTENTLKSIQNVDVTGVDAASGQITTAESVGVANGDVVLVAINIPVTKFSSLTEGTSTPADFRAIELSYSDIINGTAVDEDNLPMMGNGTLTLAADNRNFTTSITVYHLTAKIGLKSVKANFTSAKEKFVPTKVYLLNVPEKITMNYTSGTYTFPTLGDNFYQGGTNTTTGYDWYDANDTRMNYSEAFGTGATALTAETLYGTKAWTQKYYFYCLPNNTTFDNNVAATANKDLRLVVEGTYTNVSGTESTQYYPIVIDQLNGNSGNGVQPNKYYEIDLLIGGPGTTNPYANPVNTYTTTVNVIDVSDFTLVASSASFASDGATYSAADAAVHTPVVGEFLYADGTWGKYPQTSDIVGVIFSNTAYDATYTNGMAFALKDASTAAAWSNNTSADNTGVTDLTYTGSDKADQAAAYAVMSDLTASGNNGLVNTNGTVTAGFIGTGDTEAFYAAKNYGTTVSGFTNSGWFLPSIGELMTMCYNVAGTTTLDPTSYVTTDSSWGDTSGSYGVYYAGKADAVREALNALLTATGGTADTDFNYFSGGANEGTGNAAASYVCYWSSSEWSSTHAFHLHFGSHGALFFVRDADKSTATFRVRPVLAF